MKVDMTVVLKDLKGKSMKAQEYFTNPKFIDTLETPNEDPQGVRLIDRTLSSVCVNSLNGVLAGDDKLSGSQKNDLFRLSLRIQDNDHAELNNDQIKTIMDRVGKNYGPLIVGRAFEILDPPSDEKEEKTDEKKKK